MTITAADIDVLKSATGTSDGGAESATEIVTGVANNIWPNLSDGLRSADGTRIKKFFVKNNSGSDSMLKPSVWIDEQPAGMTVSIGLGVASADDADNAAGNLTAWTSNAKVSLSSSTVDSRTATIFGLDTSGEPVKETVTITGPAEVLSVTTYSKVWSVYVSALSGSAALTIKQGSAGATRGTIPIGRLVSFLWVAGISRATGIKIPNLAPGVSIPIWCRQAWSAGIAAQRPTRQIVAIEENP